MSGIKLQSKTFYKEAVAEIVKQNKGVNLFALPQIDRISINVGVGKYDTKQRNEIVTNLEKLTGQKPKEVVANNSIAGFNLRKGTVVGLVTTLRGQKMNDFLTQLIYIALPRTRDFKGISDTSFDALNSTYSMGISTCSIFPVIGFDSSVDFGMQINIVFKNKSEKNKELLTKLKFPFKK